MTEMEKMPSTMRPEMMLEGAQRGLACWSQAFREVAEGLVQAGRAHVEAARALCAAEAGDLNAMATHTTPHEAGEHLISNAHARYDAAVNAYRKINDDLAAHLFKAAETLMGAFTDEPPQAAKGKSEAGPEAGGPKQIA